MRLVFPLRQASTKACTYCLASELYSVWSSFTSVAAWALPSSELVIRSVITSPSLLTKTQ